VGIAGVAGNGQDELFSALSGERLASEGSAVVIDGEAAGLLSVTDRRRMGAAFVPEERLGHGAAPRMKLSENALLTGHAASGMVKRGFINKPAMLAHVDRTTKTFDVRKAKRDPEAVSLSGGNLQKFVVGREILREPGVLIVNQPTWGVDAGAAATIRQALIDLSARGAAVLAISQDLDELAEIADRIAVMFHGRLSAPLEAAEATREKLGLLMGGANPESEVRASPATASLDSLSPAIWTAIARRRSAGSSMPTGSEANMAAFTLGIALSNSTVRGHILWADGRSSPYHFR